MKKNINQMKKLLILVNALFVLSSLTAQEEIPKPISEKEEAKKETRAWEFGLGGSLVNWNRVSVTGFQNLPEQYLYDLKVDHIFGGGNLYVARELNKWFYLDLQGTIGALKDDLAKQMGESELKMFYMGGLGLQWRLSPMFKSRYVEPYLRVGINYLYKDFKSTTSGAFRDDPTGQAHWESTDAWNPSGHEKDKKSFMPISVGVGINSWLSNSWGLGIQGEYLMPLEKDLPSFAQLTLRVMYRIGGKDKLPAPITITRTVEKPVEVEKIIEKIVEKEVIIPASPQICEIVDNVNFEFDQYTLTNESELLLDKAAEWLKLQEGEYFLITGHTDARGSDKYNMELSRKRANAVVEALQSRGVPEKMLKSRGLGKRAVAVGANETDQVRVGDRKVTIERITKIEYWNRLPKSQ